MNANYYRFLYYDFQGGLYCSGSIGESGEAREDAFHVLYLAGGEAGDPEEEKETGKAFHMTILADFGPMAVKEAVRLMDQGAAGEVIYPRYTKEERSCMAETYAREGVLTERELCLVRDPEGFFRDRGVARALEENTEFFRCGQRFRLFSVGSGTGKSLVLYHDGGEGTPKTEECRMNVKPVPPHGNCSAFVDPSNLNCEMRCMLYNDFTQCKRHNGKTEEEFLDGHLILGMADLSEDLEEIRENCRDVWERIRFVALPPRTGENSQVDPLLSVGKEGFAQYFIGSEKTDAGIMKKIHTGNTYRRFFCVKGEAGLCISGSYSKK